MIKDKKDRALVDGDANNVRAPKAELRFNIDNEDALVYLKLLPLHASDDPRAREMQLNSYVLSWGSCR